MKRLFLLLPLLPALASAQDMGELVFTKACSRCHQAQQPTERPKASLYGNRDALGPAMSQVRQKMDLDQLRTWVKAPHRVNPKTACDTRLMAPEEMDALMGFLATVTIPTPPPRRQLLDVQVEQHEKERTLQRKAEEKAKTQSNNQGKK
ncbi:c-type cytochrome [Corallococcus exiguus]|uniref:c-type cytochrome n=1 Tax=Corallococcus exiguus TaxID=83462 RepID=UPI00155FABB9|nr:c-type cytochrome [Corallococcus exiguus]NRD43439.1 c-type cytochrome [Corallococcus exiguus]